MTETPNHDWPDHRRNPTYDVLTFDVATLRTLLRLLNETSPNATTILTAAGVSSDFLNGWQADRRAILGTLHRLIEEGAAT